LSIVVAIIALLPFLMAFQKIEEKEYIPNDTNLIEFHKGN